METALYVRKPFPIEAVRVTEENFDEVLAWSGGIRDDSDSGHKFIRIDVQRALNDRQKKAYVGDWVLKVKGSFKVYENHAFTRNFVPRNQKSRQVTTVTNIYNNAPVTEHVPDAAPDSPKVELPVDDQPADSPRQQV